MMDQKEEMKKNLLEELDDYFMQLVYLKDLLSVEEDICDSREKLQCAPNFTLIVECALIDSYMIILMRLYDKSDKTQTIPNLIKKCKKKKKKRIWILPLHSTLLSCQLWTDLPNSPLPCLCP